jgi:hypothetical protein
MSCPEYNRLRQHYEAALRYWGHVLLSPDANLVGAPARQATEIKQKAYTERNAAKYSPDAWLSSPLMAVQSLCHQREQFRRHGEPVEN